MMVDTSTELMNSYSPAQKFNILLGIVAMYLVEFSSVMVGPFFSKIASVATKLAFGLRTTDLLPWYQPSTELLIDEVEDISLLDDRAASVGDESDLYMLRTYGFEKHRFLSAAFIRRNRLKQQTKKS